LLSDSRSSSWAYNEKAKKKWLYIQVKLDLFNCSYFANHFLKHRRGETCTLP
jgi:hypothetical protein